MRNIIVISSIGFLPKFVFAQTEGNFIVKFFDFLDGFISGLFPVMVAIAILAVGYTIIKYLASNDIAERGIYKAGIINSVIGLFVIMTLFGIVRLMAQNLGITEIGQSITTVNPDGISPGSASISGFRNYVLIVAKFLSTRVIPIVTAIAVLVFMGNTAIAMTKTDSEEERKNIKAYLQWGVFAIFLIFVLFGIIGLITGSLFGSGAMIPQFPTS